MEKRNNPFNEDSLFEQMARITKASAYDVIAPHAAELKEQNVIFRKALNDVVQEIITTPAADTVNNPAELLRKIAAICQDTLSKNRPL